MRALEIRDGLLRLIEAAVPQCPPGEVLIKPRLMGVCDTDLQLRRGYMGFCGIPGHEFVGEVVSGPQEWLGQRVVAEINAACGDCDFCRKGLERHCPKRSVLGILGRAGAHAERVAAPITNLHRVPDSVPDSAAVFTEPLAAACEILEQVHIQPESKVAVIGDGKLGLLCARVLALTGCDLRVIGRHARKLALLDAQKILTELVPSGQESSLPAGWADMVVDCSGSPTGFASARRLLRARGTLILKTTIKDAFQLDLAELVVNEISIRGSRCGPFAAALRLLERGLVQVEDLIDSERSLSEGVEAYEEAGRRGAMKVLLRP